MILGFDTSGPHCAIAICDGQNILAETVQPMAKGQAEHLLPLIDATLRTAQITRHDLTGIGVGVGPGNFTGIRIAVAAARGLALALDRPAIGITTFEAALNSIAPVPPAALVALPGPRDVIYVQAFGGPDSAPRLLGPDDPLPPVPDSATALLITPKDATLPDRDWPAHLRRMEAGPIAPAIARLAGQRLHITPLPRPKPLYLKPADAAPSREAGPTLLAP